jgi:hypothetical protein
METCTVTYRDDAGSVRETAPMTAGDAWALADRLHAAGTADATVLSYL